MAVLTWDVMAERTYETGVDRCVLYPMDSNGDYPLGVAWNGIVSITESPSGAEPTPHYADNIKYLNLISAEEFAATLEAYTYPDEFAACDGQLTVGAAPGMLIGQQTRKQFGLSYRTVYGNAVDGNDYGYKLHLLYGLTAAPSEKAYSSINESPEAITFSWEISSIPDLVTGYSPTSVIVVDSLTPAGLELTALEEALWGTATPTDPYLPHPDAVITLLTP